MKKILIIILFSIVPLFATMQMQTIVTKKIIVGTFDTFDELSAAQEILTNNGVLKHAQKHNGFSDVIRIDTNKKILVIEKFKNMKTALEAFVIVSKYYPKAYLVDDSYVVAVEIPDTLKSTEILTTAEAGVEIETVSDTNDEEQIQELVDLYQEDEFETDVVMFDTSADTLAQADYDQTEISVEVLAIQNALEHNQTFDDQTAAGAEVIATQTKHNQTIADTAEANVIPQVETMAQEDVITANLFNDEKYKRKPPKEEPLFTLSTLIYALVVILVFILLLIWRRSRNIDAYKILERHENN